ncbi:MAG: ABC transporter permease [Roseiflexaceae bacterium]|nr:ABC transporter permease [Roseiflexaceae bacterium]
MAILDNQQVATPPQQPQEVQVPTMVIQPTKGWQALQLGELWKYRELLYFLIWRDVKVRYKQTQLGIAWALIPPFVTMLVFSLIFGNLAKIESDGIPYPIFSFAGLLPWQLFSLALTSASNSLVNSANLLRKVYFPRLTIPVASVLAGLVDFGLSFLVLIGMMAYYRIIPTLAILLLPVFTLLTLVTVMGVGLWLAALNVQYRDIRYVVPFMTQIWMFATPVVYPSSLFPEPWRTLSGLNPMAGVIEGFRWALLGTQPPGAMIIVSSAVAILVLITGLMYFRRVEQTFADIV